MRIDPCSVNTFFNENVLNVTVWLGCEQRDRIFGNYCLLIVFVEQNRQRKKAPKGLLDRMGSFIGRLVNAYRTS
ncbi:hypothetical protein A8A57_21735 [Lelliottia amnigena]|nr:hypothetical protein A8A57_21735 [Lelliottia amnigena]